MSFLPFPGLQNEFQLTNFLKDGNFERQDAYSAQVTGPQYWNAYADAAATVPVNGTGGSPTVIRNAIVSSSTLDGLRSDTITKTGNAQGEGYSTDFTVPLGYLTEPLNISFLFSAGSAYTAGDLAVFIYDVTNAALIYPSITAIPGGTGMFTATFAPTNSQSYRLIIHCAASNATTSNWSMMIDNVVVSPIIENMGSIVTNWASYTPVLFGATNGLQFSNYTVLAYWRRVGDSVECNFRVSFTGTPATGTGALNLTLPAGLTIDSTKVVSTSLASVGFATLRDSGTANYNLIPTTATETFSGAGSVSFTVSPSAVSANGLTLTNPITLANNDFFSGAFLVPVTGWSSNVNLVDSTEEFVFNTGTWDAADTTSFGYGPAGQLMGGALAANRTKRVRFRTPIQPTDVLILEYNVNGQAPWTAANEFVGPGGASYVAGVMSGTAAAGVAGHGIAPVTGSATDVDVIFGRYSFMRGDGTGVADYTNTVRWRLRKAARANVASQPQTTLYLAAGTQAGIADNTATDVGSSQLYVPPGMYVVTVFGQASVVASVVPTSARAQIYLTDTSNVELNANLGTTGIATTNGTNMLGSLCSQYLYPSSGITVKMRALIDVTAGTVSSRDANQCFASFQRISG